MDNIRMDEEYENAVMETSEAAASKRAGHVRNVKINKFFRGFYTILFFVVIPIMCYNFYTLVNATAGKSFIISLFATLVLLFSTYSSAKSVRACNKSIAESEIQITRIEEDHGSDIELTKAIRQLQSASFDPSSIVGSFNS